MRSPVLNSYYVFFLAFVFDPASPIAGHLVMAREHYRQASGWYSVDGFSGSRVDLFSIRLVKNLWRIQLCQFPYKDIRKCPPSNDPKFHLLHRCRSRMSERSCWLQPKFHLLFSWQICVSLSPACDHGGKPATAYFKYKRSLKAKTGVEWVKDRFPSVGSRHWEVPSLSIQQPFPLVLALILSRFYSRERTCNAGI